MSDTFETVRTTLRRSPTRRADRLAVENRRLREAIGMRWPRPALVGETPAARQLAETIAECAALDTTVLVWGERGVGKGLVARLIHQASKRSSGPFVVFSCAAVPKRLIAPELFGVEQADPRGRVTHRLGRLELADRGTLLLTEIDELPLAAQPRLLSYLRRGTLQRVGGRARLPVGVRIIASTSRDLRARVRARLFDRRLLGRLRGGSIRVPTLRDRWQDIPAIAEWFLVELARQPDLPSARLGDTARKCLLRYPWPGNVRELQDVLVRAALLSTDGRIGREHLPRVVTDASMAPSSARVLPSGLALRDIERLAIDRTLAACHGNRAEAARRLGLSKKGFYLKMKRFGLG